jgi:heme exporter protein C
MGRADDLDARPALPLHRLYRACRRRPGAGRGGRVVAIFGLIGAINIPIIRFSVEWWNTLHQGQSISFTGGGSSIDASMLWPLLGSALGFSLLFGAVVLMRMRAILARQKVEARLRRMNL